VAAGSFHRDASSSRRKSGPDRPGDLHRLVCHRSPGNAGRCGAQIVHRIIMSVLVRIAGESLWLRRPDDSGSAPAPKSVAGNESGRVADSSGDPEHGCLRSVCAADRGRLTEVVRAEHGVEALGTVKVVRDGTPTEEEILGLLDALAFLDQAGRREFVSMLPPECRALLLACARRSGQQPPGTHARDRASSATAGPIA
jgi:hypothetical protein